MRMKKLAAIFAAAALALSSASFGAFAFEDCDECDNGQYMTPAVSLWNTNDFQHQQYCQYCRRTKEWSDHELQVLKTGTTETTHIIECSVCQYRTTAAHVDADSNGVCDECDATGITIVCLHRYPEAADVNCGEAIKCTKCNNDSGRVGTKHSFPNAESVPCSEDVKCANCDATNGKGLEHSTAVISSVAPTCTAAGKTEGLKCSVCQIIIQAQEDVPALGHDYVDGVCTRCGDVYSGDDEPNEPNEPNSGSNNSGNSSGGANPSAAVLVSDSGSAPASGSGSSAAGTGPSSSKPVTAEQAEEIIRSGSKVNVTYNAKEAGITEDILSAFADNKRAKTLKASLGDVTVKINKSDISDAKALDSIDTTKSSKKILSDKQLENSKLLKDSKDVIQLNFKTSEKFDGLDKVTLQVKTDKKLRNRNVVIYEKVGNKIVRIGTAKVGKDGSISFDADHLGKFIVSVK